MPTLFPVSPLERKVTFTPARNWRHADSSKDFGHIGMRIMFSVTGDMGAISWLVYPGWYVKSTRDAWTSPKEDSFQPGAWYLSAHAYTSDVAGEEAEPCDLLLGGKCYCHSSALDARGLVEPFLAGGDEWLWSFLEAYYRFWFEDAPRPSTVPQYLPHPNP